MLHNPYHYGNGGGGYNQHLANSFTALQQHHPNVAVPAIPYQPPQNSQTGIPQQGQINQQTVYHQQQATPVAQFNPQVNPGAPVGLPPNHPYLQDYAHLVLKNITRLQQQENQVQDVNNNFIPGLATNTFLLLFTSSDLFQCP